MQKQGKSTVNSAIAVAVWAAAFTAAGEEPASSRIVEGNLRVQVLSPTLVRIEMDVPAWKVALFARRGGMILLGPDMQWTQEKPWDPIAIEAFPPAQDGETARELYEDEGLRPGYLANEFSRTPILLKRQGGRVSVGIAAAAGSFKGQLDKRAWVVRLRPGENLRAVSVDGKPAEAKILEPRAARELSPTAHEGIPLPLAGAGDAPPPQAGPVVEVNLPAADIRQAREAVLEVVH